MTAQYISIAVAQPSDVPLLLDWVRKLAEHRKFPESCQASAELLTTHLLGPRPAAHAVVARVEGKPAGYAVFFATFSTLICTQGFWLEDLFVLPEHRRKGVGTALLRHAAKATVRNNNDRLEWSVPNGDQSALDFFRRNGAQTMQLASTRLAVRVDDQNRFLDSPLNRATPAMNAASIEITPALESDVPLLLEFIRRLAEYEKLSDHCKASTQLLTEHLFGPQPAAQALVARLDGQPAGFALFFPTFSTFVGKPGIWLEDLFVLPEHRRKGVGRALLRHVAQLAVQRGCGRLEWSVLDWNTPALNFYRRIGAQPMNEWTSQRLAGDALASFSQTPPAGA